MRTKQTKFISVLILLSLLIGVTTIASARFDPEQVSGTGYVKFGHFAPIASDINATELEVSLGAGIQFTFIYEDIHPFHPDEVPPPESYLEITSGTYLLTVTPAGSGTPVISENITIGDATYNTIAITGNDVEQPIEAVHLVDENPGTVSPTSAITRFTHVAPFASDLQDLVVDVCVGGQIWLGLEDIPYKELTDTYFDVPQGEYNIDVATADSNCQSIVYSFPRLYFRIGQVADMFVIGDGVLQDFDHATTTGLLYVLPSPQGSIRFGHFSQFADNEAASSVTVKIDGVDTLTDFVFKETTGYMEIDAGPHTIEVFETGTATLLATADVTISEDAYYTSGIIGDDDDQDIEVYTLLDETTPPADGAKLRVVHAAPIAPVIADTKVDVCSNGSIFEGLSDVEYKDFTDPYLLVLAQVFNLYVAEPDGTCDNLLWSIEAFSLAELAIGDLWILDHDSYCWGCDGVGGDPQVNLAHVAPFENNYNLTAIRIVIDNMVVRDDFYFLQFSGYGPMMAGTHYVEMILDHNDQLLASGWITLEGDKSYSLHLIGDGDNQPLEVWLLEDDTDPLEIGGKIRFAHVAPVAPNIADTLIDICDADNNVIEGLTELPYKFYSDPYEVFDAGYYPIKGTESGKHCSGADADYFIGLYPYIINNGDISTIYLFGANLIPTGQIPWPDISAYQLYLNIMWKHVLVVP